MTSETLAARSGWRKGIAEWDDPEEPEVVNISVVFTWDAARAYQRAVWHRQQGRTVRVGGPGVFVHSVRREFREVAQSVGGELEDAIRFHNPAATFSSRGCPVGCSFCIVPAMEGREFTLLPDFQPRPVLCDSNLSALPDDYQDYVVAKYLGTGTPLHDANSGFEPRTFDQRVLHRWSRINRGPWRFAYDETPEGPDVHRVCRMLTDLPPSLKRVYVLIGNEPFQACLDRVLEVIGWGAEPHVQPEMKLNATVREPWVKHDWNTQLLRDLARWANQWIWRKCSFQDYRRNLKSGQRPVASGQFALGGQGPVAGGHWPVDSG